MTDRVWNFSPGPAPLPLPVLEEARELLLTPGAGASILEISHRSAAFDAVIEEAEANLRDLLEIPASHRALFLQGRVAPVLDSADEPAPWIDDAGRVRRHRLVGGQGGRRGEEGGHRRRRV